MPQSSFFGEIILVAESQKAWMALTQEKIGKKRKKIEMHIESISRSFAARQKREEWLG